jgi:8-amino-7-oxononanoate synthase
MGYSTDPPLTDLFEKARVYDRPHKYQVRGLYPYFRAIRETKAETVFIDGHELVMAGSNNYLGYTHDPRVLEAAAATALRYGSSCSGSRFLNGTLELHEQLETELADFTQKEAALVFSTGFQTNLGTISCLIDADDVVVIDKLVHASILDGARLTRGQVRRFNHNDMGGLERTLAGIENGCGRLVAVDGMFSMEGDVAPLREIVPLCRRYGARLLVDEAHAVGVLGERGIGTAEELGVLDETDLIVGTFSKAFASIGGFVAGEKKVIQYIKHHARSLIFSASMPPYAIATVRKTLELIRAEPERRVRVRAIADRVRAGLKDMGFDTAGSITPVVPVVTGDLENTFAFWKRLFEEGVFTNPVIPPAVPPDSCLIRTSYMATHTDEHVERILEAFRKVGLEFGMVTG